MKIRLMGLQEECEAALHELRTAPRLAILEVSGPYPNRGDSRQVRVYVEAQLYQPPASAAPDPSGGRP
ncbi:hypothetical protein [Micromonospora thermarum]|uniref:Uncharacterized protein n=1 Tax=Micromonospora thermarum TaxID=2720024 RepID=A0ABX0ZC91_9ACTN|nr:hypothetical protein [Micromonospora thermarum]NJP33711.1 hypothetical protein [Micromonospora thermarum]